MRVHVLLYDAGKDTEGIHSLELSGKTIVLMFENPDDAERYSGLLEAQDFPIPTIEALNRDEIEAFCSQAGYEARLVEAGFVPKTEEERLLLSPPDNNKDVSNWDDNGLSDSFEDKQLEPNIEPDNLDEIRKRFEGLL